MMKNGLVNSILIGLALSLSACEKPVEAVSGPRPALVMTIQSEGANSTMAIVGEIKARYASIQGFRVAGKVIKRYVNVGDLVKKGQVLARLDNVDASLALQANQAEISAAESVVALAKDNLARQQQLLDKKFISAAALDRYETDYKTAQARLTQVQAKTAVTNNQARYTTLRADRSGVVNMINAEPGQVVAAGQGLVQIIDPKQLEVHIPLAESRMADVAIGDSAIMRLWSNREIAYPVKVREIAPMANAATRTFLVKLTILAPNNAIRLGMTASVVLNNAISDALLVPSPAVFKRNNETIIWLVDADNKVHAKNVVVESFREDGVLIKSGLTVGDKIVVAGAQALINDQSIRPVER